jgi:hypothetical protein
MHCTARISRCPARRAQTRLHNWSTLLSNVLYSVRGRKQLCARRAGAGLREGRKVGRVARYVEIEVMGWERYADTGGEGRAHIAGSFVQSLSSNDSGMRILCICVQWTTYRYPMTCFDMLRGTCSQVHVLEIKDWLGLAVHQDNAVFPSGAPR